MSSPTDGRYRSSVRIGSTVGIVQKQDQKSGRMTKGTVAEILTSTSFHPHGIKVRLRDGKVGRVVAVLSDGDGPAP
ncbi:MAG TPA: YwbE family protein [Methanomicrobiales archaeon]|nr:YwbE family protein [Methanomicrobiales archaeon]